MSKLTSLAYLADMFLKPQFIEGWCQFIALYAIFFILLMWSKQMKISDELEDAQKILNEFRTKKNFTEGLDNLAATFRNSPILLPLWNEYADQLIRSSQKSGNDMETVKSARQATEFFNDQTLIGPNMNVRFFSAIASHLTGLGILGTFIGLAAGIGQAQIGMGFDNLRQLHASLSSLLSGASLAFITSIFGISCSIIFIMIERTMVFRLQKRINRWNYAVDSKVDLISHEKLLAQQIDQQADIYSALADMNSKISGLTSKISGETPKQ